jgi:hypothetical protein
MSDNKKVHQTSRRMGGTKFSTLKSAGINDPE